MYPVILVTLDGTQSDQTIIQHIIPLARQLGSEVQLLHVADGWAARTFGSDAVSPEVVEDNAYLDQVRLQFSTAGVLAQAHLAYGDPSTEIINWIRQNRCDLLAMSTHGHRLIGDVLHGTTAHHVQHRVEIPVLLLKVPREGK